jgi:hypothetical protein
MIKIGDIVRDLFGRTSVVIELRETHDSDGNPATVAKLNSIAPGDHNTTFEQNVTLLKRR